MNTQPPLLTSPSPRPRLSRNARIAATGLAASVAVFLVVVVLMLVSGGDDGVAAAPSASRSPQPPSAEASGSPVPSMGPTGSPGPTAPPTSKPDPTPLPISFPVSAYTNSVLMTPGPNGGLYVAVPDDDGSVVLALVGPDGAVRPGWPLRVRTLGCMQLLTAGDGTLRAICDGTPEGEGLQAPVTRIFAYDPAGRSVAGWPVDVEGSMYEYGAPMAVIDGTDLSLVIRVYQGDELPEGVTEPARLVLVDGAGDVRTSDDIDLQCCDSGVVPGSGVAYVLNRDYFEDGSTQVTAFGLDGEIWRTSIDAVLSNPAFDARDNAYFTAWHPGSGSHRIVVVNDVGDVVRASDELPMAVGAGYTGAGPEYPGAPIAAPDGSAFVVGYDHGLAIMALDPNGQPRSGWPHDAGLDIALHGFCPSGDTGCGLFDVRPQVGPDGTLFVATMPGELGGGGQLGAIRPTGDPASGWPVGLRRGGSTFWDVVVGSDGGVWALAAEPEATETYSGTLLSIAPDSTVRGRLTITEP
jgi:hypothetical protein